MLLQLYFGHECLVAPTALEWSFSRVLPIVNLQVKAIGELLLTRIAVELKVLGIVHDHVAAQLTHTPSADGTDLLQTVVHSSHVALQETGRCICKATLSTRRMNGHVLEEEMVQQIQSRLEGGIAEGTGDLQGRKFESIHVNCR